ncbi:unnamed protein product, partial [Didymodactylos carnosus]
NDDEQTTSNTTKRHFNEISIRPLSATSTGGGGGGGNQKKKHVQPHLTSGNRNSTDNLIQSSIDVTLSTNSSSDKGEKNIQPKILMIDEEMPVVTIFGVEDSGNNTNGDEYIINRNVCMINNSVINNAAVCFEFDHILYFLWICRP